MHHSETIGGHAETAGGCGQGVAPFGNNKRPCLKQPEAAETAGIDLPCCFRYFQKKRPRIRSASAV
ncbi:MAG: hypothetical protein LBD24_03425 [Spirochaetaceae bacterium]|nr:hypothetical protein [Spirochaetaceae bacterium]